jgi:hypothetical protein
MPEVFHDIELDSLRDENGSLQQECQELRAENKRLNDSINEIVEMLSPSYDKDDSPEGIIKAFIKDMQSLAQIVAKLTADYR